MGWGGAGRYPTQLEEDSGLFRDNLLCTLPHATASCALWPQAAGPAGLGLYNDRGTLVKKTGQGQQEGNLGTTGMLAAPGSWQPGLHESLGPTPAFPQAAPFLEALAFPSAGPAFFPAESTFTNTNSKLLMGTVRAHGNF